MLTLIPAPGRTAEVIEAYRELKVLEQAIELCGALSGELSVAEDDTIAVLALWPTEQDYQGWLEHPARAEIGAAMETLVTTSTSRTGRISLSAHSGAGEK
ncbi:antibiotic biosynthesis monooxygenase family protein [Brevibacterium album]|uniref:antibiotic biosynthesis monooxygenase family protein n=1 Tax=Brevibacterium album TaxID=417948 RepID=UPI000404315D|nr:hypothetical protein [Brevibacterium album]